MSCACNCTSAHAARESDCEQRHCIGVDAMEGFKLTCFIVLAAAMLLGAGGENVLNGTLFRYGTARLSAAFMTGAAPVFCLRQTDILCCHVLTGAASACARVFPSQPPALHYGRWTNRRLFCDTLCAAAHRALERPGVVRPPPNPAIARLGHSSMPSPQHRTQGRMPVLSVPGQAFGTTDSALHFVCWS